MKMALFRNARNARSAFGEPTLVLFAGFVVWAAAIVGRCALPD